MNKISLNHVAELIYTYTNKYMRLFFSENESITGAVKRKTKQREACSTYGTKFQRGTNSATPIMRCCEK